MNAQIKKACECIGSQAAMARALGVTTPTVNQWVLGRRPVPAERCPAIEQATHGEVRCEELRPDVNWGYLRGTERRSASREVPHVMRAKSANNGNKTAV